MGVDQAGTRLLRMWLDGISEHFGGEHSKEESTKYGMHGQMLLGRVGCMKTYGVI